MKRPSGNDGGGGDTWRGVMELETARGAHSSLLVRVHLVFSYNTQHALTRVTGGAEM